MILLAATSKSPIKAATTDVREDDFLRLPIGNVAIASLRKMRGYVELVSGDGWRRGKGLPRIANHRTIGVSFSLLRVTCAGPIWHDCRCMSAAQFLCTKCRPDSIKKSPSRGGIAAYGSIALKLSRSGPDEFRELAEEALTNHRKAPTRAGPARA
jgi:hypothetical protein